MAYRLYEIKSGEPQTFQIRGADFLVNLEFSGNFLYHYNPRPLPCVSLMLSRPQLRLEEEARQWIHANLRTSLLTDEHRHEVVEIALRTTRESVARMPKEHNFFGLRFDVNLFDDWEIEELEQVRMVPATEPSIENLERKKAQLLVEGSGCVICMEEFSFDCEVACMPCLHDFHGDCIKEWLRTSHYCPVCRFEMPTKS